MNEPARSMAASLANLEAHRPEPPRTGINTARNYLGQAAHELSKLRIEILDAEVAWKRKRAELQSRYDDDLAKLSNEYAALLTELADMKRRLEIMRGEV